MNNAMIYLENFSSTIFCLHKEMAPLFFAVITTTPSVAIPDNLFMDRFNFFITISN